MAYVNLETTIRHHQKFLDAGPDASWLWFCGLAHAQEALTDGFISTAALRFLGVKGTRGKLQKLADTLVSVHLWEVVDGGWRIHDYLHHNKSADEVRDLRRLRREWGLKGGRPRKNLQGSQPQNLQGFDSKNLPENPVRVLDGTTGTSTSRSRACVFEGMRLKVSEAQHRLVSDELGINARYIDLLDLYPRWDGELVQSGEPFDTLLLLKRRAAELVRAARAGGLLGARKPKPATVWDELVERVRPFDDHREGRLFEHAEILEDSADRLVIASPFARHLVGEYHERLIAALAHVRPGATLEIIKINTREAVPA